MPDEAFALGQCVRVMVPAEMSTARRWLLHDRNKVPHYVDGDRRCGALDGPEDVARLASLEDALAALKRHAGWGLGFALGHDPALGATWQGIDFDHLVGGDGQVIDPLYARLYGMLAGYAERSPSGDGLHVIGLGRPFAALRWPHPRPKGAAGIECYAGGRYFTVTGDVLRIADPVDLHDAVEAMRAEFATDTDRGRPRIAAPPPRARSGSPNRTAANIDTYNREHPIERELDRYGFRRYGNRWLSPRSETGLPGVRLMDDGRAVSWHASDAGLGTPVAEGGAVIFDAFDLAVFHDFGGDRMRAIPKLLAGLEAQATDEGWLREMIATESGRRTAPAAPPESTSEQQAGPSVGSAGTPARRPLDILREYPAPGFTEACVPAAIWRLAEAFSVATGFDRNGVVMAATVAAAAMIDDRLRLAVRPGSEWFESARLWAVLIGPPSAGKTPTLRVATDPIKALHGDLVRQWSAENPEPDEKSPPRPALYTSDATIEKLSEMLKDNPRGMLMLTEEFASWIGSIDAYRDGGGPKNRGEWLQLYDGGAHQVDRVKRGSFLVPNWSCSVLAAATPAGLRTHLRQLPDDGLIHRFMPVVLRRPAAESEASAKGEVTVWHELLREIHRTTTREVGAKANRLSVNATMLFDHARREIRDSVDALAEVSPALASHVGKHPGMIARVAHVFHLVDRRQGDAIEADTMGRAIAFMRVVRAHAVALYLGILGQSPALELARAVARTILAGAFTEVGRHHFTQHCRAWRSAPEPDQRQAVQLLTDADWLIPDPNSRAYGGWPASRWIVDPAVHDLFAEHGRQHKQRRATVKAAIDGTDGEA